MVLAGSWCRVSPYGPLATTFARRRTQRNIARRLCDNFISPGNHPIRGRSDGRCRVSQGDSMKSALESTDPEIAAAIRTETERQAGTLELIASENFVSEAVLEAMGSVFTNKYAEGYPGRRYYGGCGPSDTVEDLAKRRALELFGAEHANVQPHSGTQANTAVYMTVCKPGDTVLGMNLSHGGHLTHGHPLNFSGIMYRIVPYGVTRDTETIDYDALEALAREHRPSMIVIGASAYSRTIDFERIGGIAKSSGARTMADIAHIAGLVA